MVIGILPLYSKQLAKIHIRCLRLVAIAYKNVMLPWQ